MKLASRPIGFTELHLNSPRTVFLFRAPESEPSRPTMKIWSAYRAGAWKSRKHWKFNSLWRHLLFLIKKPCSQPISHLYLQEVPVENYKVFQKPLSLKSIYLQYQTSNRTSAGKKEQKTRCTEIRRETVWCRKGVTSSSTVLGFTVSPLPLLRPNPSILSIRPSPGLLQTRLLPSRARNMSEQRYHLLCTSKVKLLICFYNLRYSNFSFTRYFGISNI